MKHRKALWQLCVLMLLVCAGWQALVGTSVLRSRPGAARPNVREVGDSGPGAKLEPRPPKADASRLPARKPVVSYVNLPLRFEPNRGQTDKRVRFLSHGRGYGLFLTADEAVLELQDSGFRSQDSGPETPGSRITENDRTTADVRRSQNTDNEPRTTDGWRLKLVNANQNAAIDGGRELPGKVNYLIGNDSRNWHTNIPTYAEVKCRNVYRGIDLVYYGKQGGELEYDFIVAPGADPGVIGLDVRAGLVSGQGRPQGSPLRITRDGDLVLATESGQVRILRPVVYQEIEPGAGYQNSGAKDEIQDLKFENRPSTIGNRQLSIDDRQSAIDHQQSTLGNRQSAIDNRQFLEGRFTLDAENRVRFALGAYDHTRPLVIDPVLVYSSYLGGAGDQGKGIAVDTSGNAYVTGTTLSTSFPVVGPYQSNNKAQSGTVFVSKLNAAGSALVYSTYLGGSLSDRGNAIALDSAGDAYLTGSTCSSDFPTVSPLQASLKGVCDGFVAELSAAGSSLVYSTYLGGSGANASGTNLSDEGTGIAVDSTGAAYVTGGTWSTDFPTVNPIQGYGGGEDAFLSKISANGSALVYSTYLGGSGQDEGSGIAVDSSGNAYVIGFTLSSDFPTVNAFQPANHATMYGTAFVAKLNSAGSALVYSTYLGGSTMESGAGIAVDSSGNAYLTGTTWSSNFPTVTPMQATNNSKYGGSNAFVVKMNAAGSALIYSTYLGGSGHLFNPAPSDGGDSAYGIAINSAGVAFVAGLTGSLDFPTVSAVQSTNNSGDKFTAFVACLNAAGSALAYSTYLGGTGDDQANGIAIDSSDDAYVAGTTTSTDFPTVTPIQASPGGVFVAQISPPAAITFFPASLNFGTVPGDTTSPERIVTVTPIGNASVSLTSIAISGDFALETTATSCPYGGGTVAAGLNCTINVSFMPTATGARTGNLSIIYNGVGSPQIVPLSGTGIVSAANVFPTSLSFPSQDVGTQGAPQPVTLTNIGSVQLDIGSVAVSSGWTQNNNCLPYIAAKGSCTINVSFEPTVIGPLTGTLTITDYAGNSPQTVALSGTGFAPVASLSATVLTFPGQTVSTTSSPQTLTLSDTGSGALTPLTITVSGDFAQTNTCAGSVASGSSCTISVTFTPTASGARSGALTLADNASNSPQTVTLNGTGQDFTLSTPSGSSSTATVTPGQTAKYKLGVNSVAGFNQSVSVSCAGVPSEATCVASPITVAPGATLTILVTTTAPSSAAPRTFPSPPLPRPQVFSLLAMLLACIAGPLLASRRARAGRRAAFLPLAAGLLLALALAGCGGGGPAPNSNHGTPTGNYTLTVTGTVTSGSSSVSRSVNLTLNVS